MASTKKVVDDLDLSKEEIERFSKAFKDAEFRKLFKEYADEISDPENKRKYEEEIRTLENEKGMDIQFVHPKPGYVVKTALDGSVKCFINICINDLIGKPSSKKQVKPSDGLQGLSWSLPYSLAPIRDDVDKNNGKCKVIDFVIHPDTYRMAETNARFKQMIHDTAFDGIERQFNVKLDRKNMKILKMTFKGTPSPTVIRNRKEPEGSSDAKAVPDSNDLMSSFPYPYDNQTTEEKMKEREDQLEKSVVNGKVDEGKPTEEEFTKPKYLVKYRSDMDFQDFTDASSLTPSKRPKEVVIEINLPLLTSATQVDLDIYEKKLNLKSTVPSKYALDLDLTYPVNENKGSAKFDKSKRILNVTLPIIQATLPVPPVDDERVNDFETMSKKAEDLHESSDAPGTELLASPNKKIEVLSSHDVSDENGIAICGEEASKHHENGYNGFTEDIVYTSLDFDYLQDDESVSIVLHCRKVDRSTVVTMFPEEYPARCVSLKMTSIGEGGFPVHYSLFAVFPENCFLDTENCKVDVDPSNVVLVLMKKQNSCGVWEGFRAGVDETNLEEKLFLTKTNLQAQIANLVVDDSSPPLDRSKQPELDVTEMDSEKLVIAMKQNKSKRKKHISESPDEIEVVFNGDIPPIKGIMKQTSRTTSESSDEMQYGRKSSTTSYDPNDDVNDDVNDSDSGSEENNDGTSRRRKKSVSFSEHVDHTTYNSSQSVKTIRNTLKNKKKKQKKSEQKRIEMIEKTQRRRRKSSGSENPSSDDGSVGSAEHVDPLVIKGKRTEESNDRDGDDEASPSVQKTAQMEAPLSKEYHDVGRTNSERLESPVVSSKDIVCDGANGDIQDAAFLPATIDNQSQSPSNPDEVPESASKNGDLESGATADDVENCEGEGNKQSLIEELNPESKKNIVNQSKLSSDNKQDSTNKADTMLSWADGNSKEHATKCAFEFSNNVMYELDSD